MSIHDDAAWNMSFAGNQDIKDDVWDGTSNVFIDMLDVFHVLTKTEYTMNVPDQGK